MTRSTYLECKPVHISRHAKQRMDQRSISHVTVALLLEFGEAAPCGGKATAITLGKCDLQDLHEIGIDSTTVARLARLRAILSDDGAIVTVMHRYRRPASKARRMRS